MAAPDRSDPTGSAAELELEIARRDERDALIELWLELIEHHRRADPDYPLPGRLRETLGREIERSLRSPHCRVWVARLSSELTGFAVAEIETARSVEANRTRTCWIHELYVVPWARRRGIGRALVRSAEAFFRERGGTRPTVRVEARNRGALRFWRRAGYGERARILERGS